MLRRLGYNHSNAIKYANTRKGCWQVAGNQILSCTITDTRLRESGYLFFSDYYNTVSVYTQEPPYTEPFVRWCGRSGKWSVPNLLHTIVILPERLCLWLAKLFSFFGGRGDFSAFSLQQSSKML